MSSGYERKVWYNGAVMSEAYACVSVYDSALMFGDTVFEMTRSFNKKHFKLKEHIDRLYNSAKYLKINIPYTKEEIIKACEDISLVNDEHMDKTDEHRLMINVTRGLLGLYSGVHLMPPQEAGKANVIITDFPLRWTINGMTKWFENGVNAVVPSQRTIPARLLEPKVKNRSRIHYLMANIEVSQYKGDSNWPLLLDEDGFIAEGTGSNFFIVKDQKVYTPEPRNILRGISREYIMSLTEVIERNIELYDVITADEAFYTATPFCIMPCTSINNVSIGEGKVGKITKALMDRWSFCVGVNFVEQAKAWEEQWKERTTGVTPYAFVENK